MTGNNTDADPEENGQQSDADCFCGGDRPNWRYHSPDGCAAKPLAPDLAPDDPERDTDD